MMSFVMSEGLAQWVSDVHPDSWHTVLGCETYDMTRLASMPDLVAVVDDEGLIKGRPVLCLATRKPKSIDAVVRSYLEGCL